ncbi:MAG: DUF951 domain-containing protein [Clostridia bacterium]|nr:DUF951 domain-containing protein [Clostridia bacterium]
MQLSVGDILILKKKHPCGSEQFKIMRLGSDIRICCIGCDRDIMLPREKIEKLIKKA